MSSGQRVAAALVAILVIAIVAVVVVIGENGLIGGSPGAAASPSATASASASSPPTATASASASPSPSASPLDEEALLAMLTEIEEQVIAIRGLAAADIGPPDILTRAELEDELIAIFESDYPPEERERDNVTLRAFGLLGPDEDVGELQLSLLTEQVAGFYDDEEKRMVVVSDTGLDVNARMTYAHEYAHALQDAAFGLDTLETDVVGEDDRSLARTALIEGDATVVMLSWALQHLTQRELLEAGSGPIPDTSDVPDWMLEQLLFPYVAGQEFVLIIGGQDPFDVDWAAVDAAYADPPASTAQILDPDKWLGDVMPVEVDVPDLAAALGEGWEEVSASSVGEASARILLEHFGVSPFDAQDAAGGWAGDRAVVAAAGEEFALVWRSEWETEEDASAFETAYSSVTDGLAFPALATRDGTSVLVAHAATDDLLRRAVEAAR